MDSGRTRRQAGRRELPTAVKIVIAGGIGVGKTTLVGTVSETAPMRTEEILAGRITVREELVLYLFGTPGEERFWVGWDEVALGALGAVVLADTRRPADCLPAVDYFRRRDTPFVVAVNCFGGARPYELAEVQLALDLDPDVPVMFCDVRSLESCKDVLITLVEHVMARRDRPRAPQEV